MSFEREWRLDGEIGYCHDRAVMHERGRCSPNGSADRIPSALFSMVRRRMVPFLLAFLIFLAIQSGVVYVMYYYSRTAIAETLETKLSSAALAASAALSTPFESAVRVREMNSMLWRIRESHQLDVVAIVDKDCCVLASARGLSRGTRLSAFDVTPDVAIDVFDKATPQAEAVTILGDPYRRLYYPVMHGDQVWGVFCLAAYDPLPAGLMALRGALGVALGTSFVASLILGLVVLTIMRLAERAKRELVRSERLATTGTLAASIAHEVKNPLGMILSAAQLLQKDSRITSDQKELLSDIEHEARRSTDQIETFLDIARDVPLKVKEEDLCELVRATVELFAARCREAGVRIESKFPSGPVPAVVDRRKLRRVLVNLLLNAFEAMEGSAEGKVLVSVAGASSGEAMARITVEDNGVGIPEDIKELVLQPFYTTKQNGTGLGLSVARQVAEQHGGSLDMSSELGKGTCVVIRFPIAG